MVEAETVDFRVVSSNLIIVANIIPSSLKVKQDAVNIKSVVRFHPGEPKNCGLFI